MTPRSSGQALGRRTCWAALVVLAALCAERSPPADGEPGPPACPMTVRGTSVVAVETSDGVALRFITRGDVRALRVLVRRLAWRLRDHETSAWYEAIERGARIVLVPSRPELRTALRARIRRRADLMARGRCGVEDRRAYVVR